MKKNLLNDNAKMEISLKSSSLNNLNLETVSEDKQWQLDRSILKAWVWLEFLLKPDNPFVIDMFKTLNNRYNPPSRNTLSECILDEEVAKVDKTIDNELELDINARWMDCANKIIILQLYYHYF